MYEQIKNDLKDSMRARNSERVLVLRSILSAFTNENVAKKRKPDALLSKDEEISVIGRLAKQRKDSISQYTKGGRSDLADVETKELNILEEFLPAPMSREEIMDIVQKKKTSLPTADMGKLMGAVMGELKGRADGQLVKELVEKSYE